MTFSGDRAALVAAARDSIARGSKSFAAASRLFDRATRERVWLLYAWCRACDDIADGQDHGGAMEAVADGPARVARIIALTDAAYAGRVTGEMPFDALARLLGERPIPRALADDVIDGFRLDGDGWAPRTEGDLLRYCYHVAGAVGRMMAVVMGVDPAERDTLDRATDLGLAFQLANIARDVAEDAGAGRCYLPADWLAEAGVARGALLDPANDAAVGAMAVRVAAMAAPYEASARVGAARLPWRCRWAVLAAAGIYGDIARRVVARGPGGWRERVSTGRAAKVGWVARALGGVVMPVADGGRDGLWSRPERWG